MWASCTAKVVFFAFVPGFSMRTSRAYVWKGKVGNPHLVWLFLGQAALGHPWQRNTRESARVAVRCGRVVRPK